jgi:putative peptidoglycan lipid II flippase
VTKDAVPSAAAGHSTARRAGKVGLGILASRLLGLVREQVFAFLFGAGKFSDAFIVAFRIPNLLRDLFAEGALATGFIPVFSGYLVNESQQKAYRFANLVLNLVLLALGAVVVSGILGSDGLVRLIAPGFGADPDKFGLTSTLTRIVMPYILFVSLAAVAMGMLNSQHVYLVPALAPAVFNTVAVATGIALYFIKPDVRTAVVVWTWGALLGGIGQLAFQMPSLFRLKFRFRFGLSFRDEGVRKLLRLIAPAVFGLAATQINIFINTILASGLEPGSVSWLNYAFRLIMLPIGVFGVAIATVSAVSSARSAAGRDFGKIRGDLASMLKLNFFLSISSTAGLLALGGLIVNVIYQHGQFGSFDTRQTYAALSLFAAGLFAYSSVKIIVPVFYALSDPRIPVLSSLCAVAGNLAISLSTYKSMGFKGLALGTTTAAVINFLFLFLAFGKKYGGVKGHGVGTSFLKVLAASGVMGLALWGVLKWDVVARLAGGTLGVRLALMLGLVVLGIAVFFGAALLVRSEEARKFAGRFLGKGAA